MSITLEDVIKMFDGCVVEDQLRFFLQKIFGKTSGFIELRFIGQRTIQKFYKDIADVIADWPNITSMNAAGLNVYFGVCRRASESGRSEAVKELTCLWADIDRGDYDWHTIDPPADIVVSSGRGFHLYWLLTSPIPADAQARAILRGLQRRVGSDAVHDFARVLRLPCTINHKNGKPCAVVKI